MSQGQISLVIFLFMLLYFYNKNYNIKSILFSLSFMKYSLSLSLLIIGIIKRDISIFYGLIILIFAIIFFGINTNSFNIDLIFLPIKVGMEAVHPGESDLVTLLIEYGHLNSIISLICLSLIAFQETNKVHN